MRYKAVAVGVEIDGHPVEAYGNYQKHMEDWARTVADKYHTAVEIFVREDKLIGRVNGDGRKR